MKDYEEKFNKKVNSLANRFMDRPLTTIFLAIVFIGIFSFGITIISGFFSTANTVVSAPSRVINKTLQTDNIIQSYEWFYDVNAAYDARLKQVNQFIELAANETDKSEQQRLRIDMTAIQQTCRDLATKYNANSEKMNKSIFKGWSLPDNLSMGDCK